MEFLTELSIVLCLSRQTFKETWRDHSECIRNSGSELSLAQILKARETEIVLQWRESLLPLIVKQKHKWVHFHSVWILLAHKSSFHPNKPRNWNSQKSSKENLSVIMSSSVDGDKQQKQQVVLILWFVPLNHRRRKGHKRMTQLKGCEEGHSLLITLHTSDACCCWWLICLNFWATFFLVFFRFSVRKWNWLKAGVCQNSLSISACLRFSASRASVSFGLRNIYLFFVTNCSCPPPSPMSVGVSGHSASSHSPDPLLLQPLILNFIPFAVGSYFTYVTLHSDSAQLCSMTCVCTPFFFMYRCSSKQVDGDARYTWKTWAVSEM